jgi:hypothetical protein
LPTLRAAYVGNALDNPALCRAMFNTHADPDAAAPTFDVLTWRTARAPDRAI